MNNNEQRDELARDVMNAYYEASDGSGSRHWVEMADILYAAGYRQPRTITTVEEVSALPNGSQIQDADPALCEKVNGRWYIPGGDDAYGDIHISLPATVLHEPTTEATP